MAGVPEVAVPADTIAQLLAEGGCLRERAFAQRNGRLLWSGGRRIDGVVEFRIARITAARTQHTQERHTQFHPLSLTTPG